MSESQWLFSIDALDFTPSTCSREREFYDRARGVEFLFRFHAFVKDLEIWQSAILITEELLLETLCFDFVVDSPHAELLELFESLETEIEVQEYAWSLAHDS